ncbi:PLD nuclease N-terminal domain-containing protein [Flavobacterium sp. J27]|uniref:PLD nuclease N-terminal domain-containing protein n=1 Tax=Flavobacterium sp. J27 TaxID=2060419 RepID=UPI001030AA87|nr:PLD nuclease N-terminal domain-containing protein [Flavobacterium sp. J27]
MVQLGMVGIWQLMLLGVFLITILLTVIALVDILSNEFKGNNKVIWVLVVLLSNFFGALLYFTIGRKQKIRQGF